jgi:sirohydrochlorin cobaltochelatase
MHAIGDLMAAALPDVAVDVGFLEMTDPPAVQVLDSIAERAGRVVVLPLVLFGAGHAKSDIPAVLLDGRQRHQQLDLRFGAPLGVSRALVEILGTAVVEGGGGGQPLLVVARGTSDADANGDACKATRLVAEWAGAPFSQTAFTGVTGPSVVETARVFARLGYRKISVAYWFLCNGKLVERARCELEEVAAASGMELVDAGYLGPDERLVPLVCERYHQALEGQVMANCDLCAYRAPWPGREDRVGAALGVGHSHLAADHRHRH